MEETRVGFALTGSFCTLDNALRAMEETAASYPNILPILSETTAATDTRCGRAGNTLAKLAVGIADTAVTMAAKAHLRNGRPVVLAVSTNDGLAGAAKNIGALMARKHIYFVPFRQDDPEGKPTSLVADMTQVTAAIAAALEGRQLQPVLLGAR